MCLWIIRLGSFGGQRIYIYITSNLNDCGQFIMSAIIFILVSFVSLSQVRPCQYTFTFALDWLSDLQTTRAQQSALRNQLTSPTSTFYSPSGPILFQNSIRHRVRHVHLLLCFTIFLHCRLSHITHSPSCKIPRTVTE